MRKCELCEQNLKMSSQGTLHPKCADQVRFHLKHGGWPIFCESRGEARSISQDPLSNKAQLFLPKDVRRREVKARVLDAGKGKVHPDSFKFHRNGTRWAVAVSLTLRETVSPVFDTDLCEHAQASEQTGETFSCACAR